MDDLGITSLSTCISRLNRRERIETLIGFDIKNQLNVSPGLTAGSGLKLFIANIRVVVVNVSPGLTAGSGLKPLWFRARVRDKSYLPA